MAFWLFSVTFEGAMRQSKTHLTNHLNSILENKIMSFTYLLLDTLQRVFNKQQRLPFVSKGGEIAPSAMILNICVHIKRRCKRSYRK